MQEPDEEIDAFVPPGYNNVDSFTMFVAISDNFFDRMALNPDLSVRFDNLIDEVRVRTGRHLQRIFDDLLSPGTVEVIVD